MLELGFSCEREFQFKIGRKWRADYLIFRNERTPFNPLSFKKTALVEFEGGAWTRGRHTRGKGFIADLEKYNVASGLGYKVFRFTPDQVKRGEAKEFIKKWL